MTTLEELCKVAKEIHPMAYIAGGFYKDALKGKEPKDIDVFMYGKYGYKDVIEILQEYEKQTPIEEKISTAIGRFQVVKPIVIADRKLYGHPTMLVPTFDIDIARIWIDDKGIHCSEDIEEIDWKIENNLFTASLFHRDEQRTFDRAKRYEEEYGYTCLQIVREEHISKKKTQCSMSGGYSD